jgi:sugar O-acyltransferase (sialic acid O-acetyltransferase NeuD family)
MTGLRRMERKNLIIIGTGFFSEVAKAYFEEYTNYRVVAFACHSRFKKAESIYGSLLFEIERLKDKCDVDNHDVFVAIGYGRMNKMRQAVYEEIKSLGYKCTTFVHPEVKIWPSTKLGDNVFIFEDNTIQPFTRIGADTILWSGNHIGHHSKIGDHCFISSHVVVSGSCAIGNNVFIGVNATLRDGLRIGDGTLIGAGALIMKNTAPKEVYVAERTRQYHINSEEMEF